MSLRRPDTQEFWRYNAVVVGFIFLVRWMMQIKDYILDRNIDNERFDKKNQWIRLLQIYSAKLVLEGV